MPEAAAHRAQVPASHTAEGKAALSAKMPSVSVVICTKDRPIELAKALESLQAERASCTEIVVIEEADQPRQIPGVRYVHLPRRNLGFGHTRNMAVRATDADILLFLDDDCVAARGWAEALLKPLLSDPSIQGVAGAGRVRACGLVGYAG